jgi:RNA polymerase sigma-70 factor (ECF subfamily)
MDNFAVNMPMPTGSNTQAETVPRPAAAVETELLRRCVAGAPDAWRELHSLYYPVVRRFGLSLGIERDAVSDFCQEVFIQVFRYLNRFKSEAAFKTWLYRICLSQRGRVRRRRRFLAALEAVFRLNPSAAAVPSSGPLSDTVVRDAEAAIAGLKPHLQQVFVMFEIEGLEGAEIATILRCPPGTVRRRLHQARQQIEAALGADSGERSPR